MNIGDATRLLLCGGSVVHLLASVNTLYSRCVLLGLVEKGRDVRGFPDVFKEENRETSWLYRCNGING